MRSQTFSGDFQKFLENTSCFDKRGRGFPRKEELKLIVQAQKDLKNDPMFQYVFSAPKRRNVGKIDPRTERLLGAEHKELAEYAKSHLVFGVHPSDVLKGLRTRYAALTHDAEERPVKAKRSAAMDLLLTGNYKLVLKYARPFVKYGYSLEDLFQEGVLGLRYAILKFDTRSHFRLSTYAQWWIRLFMHDFLRQRGHPFVLPRRTNDAMLQMRRYAERVERKEGRIVNDFEELLRAAKLSSLRKDVRRAFLTSYVAREVSLDMPVMNDEGGRASLHEVCESDPEKNPLELCLKEERRVILKRALSLLSPVQQAVVEYRVFQGITFREIAECLELRGLTKSKISHERVRQLEEKALAKLALILRQQYDVESLPK